MKNEKNIKDIYDKVKKIDVGIIGVPEGQKRGNGADAIPEE